MHAKRKAKMTNEAKWRIAIFQQVMHHAVIIHRLQAKDAVRPHRFNAAKRNVIHWSLTVTIIRKTSPHKNDYIIYYMTWDNFKILIRKKNYF